MATDKRPSIGWIGTGRMGYEMAARLAKGGADVLVWNRTRAKAEPLEKYGAKIATALPELAAREIVFCMVSTWDDVKEVIAGPAGLLSAPGKAPRMVIECSSISLEGSADLRRMLAERDPRTFAEMVRRRIAASPDPRPIYASLKALLERLPRDAVDKIRDAIEKAALTPAVTPARTPKVR